MSGFGAYFLPRVAGFHFGGGFTKDMGHQKQNATSWGLLQMGGWGVFGMTLLPKAGGALRPLATDVELSMNPLPRQVALPIGLTPLVPLLCWFSLPLCTPPAPRGLQWMGPN